uniref:Uncharacterized protein n=1 Tax=Fagus sylvatica TaxID=28930 RepID=A0A2N9G098_FAGSY
MVARLACTPPKTAVCTSSILARVSFFDPIFEGSFGGLPELKMGHAAYRRKALDVLFPTIPIKRGMLSANREFHVVAGVFIFPTHPGLQINLLRAGKTLRAKAAVRKKKCVLLPARFFSNLVPVPDLWKSELGLVRYGPANRGHRGVFGPFEGIFRSVIPARPGKILAIREFHSVMHECVFFPTCPGSRINLLRVRKTLRASVATSVGKFRNFQQNLISSACFHARGRHSSRCRISTILVSSESLRYLLFNVLAITLSFLVRFRPVKYGIEALNILYTLVMGWSVRANFWSGQRSGQTLVKLGQPWSNLVEFGQSSPNSWKCIPDFISRVSGQRWVLVGLETARSNLGQTLVNPSQTWSTLVKLGCPVLRVDTRENPVGKNGVMTDVGDDSWSNPFEERGNDGNQGEPSLKDPLQVPDGPITRSRPKKIKEAMQGLVQSTWDEAIKYFDPLDTSLGLLRLVITPFLPPGFSRVSARKTRQPEPSRSDPTRALRIKYSQEEGPRHISQAYLGGNVCAKILSDPLQLGPRAKTLRQEVHFSYHTQLSDRQELLRSSRNLSQKLTPWHKEHSDGLRSQDHISRTQAHLCARPVPLKSRYRKLSGDTKISLPDSQQVDLRARAHWKEDTSMHDVELSDRQEFIGRKLSDGTKNVKIRHRELGQICARTGTRFEKKRAGSKTHFFSRTAAFARRVFPARNKLIREPGCVGKIMTPATSWNSRFAESIPRLIGIFAGRVHENSSDTPTSGSHNSLVRTPIRANFISLERGRRELSDDMPHDPV